MTDMTDRNALFEAMHSSAGAAYINRSHGRTFSLNIFQRNAEELIEATRNVRDPDQGLQLMAVTNREAGQQAHREISRLVHNFVAGSMTLIEHTRQFVREHYAGTTVESAYHDRVKANFGSEPVAKFVQDLRNYMLHKGLPPSQMFIEFDNTSNDFGVGGELTTGVRYETAALLNWDGWTAPARTYVAAAGEHLDIHAFAETYLEKVLLFHGWLEAELQQFHSADLAQLQAMQEAYARLAEQDTARTSVTEVREGRASSPSAEESPRPTPFEFPHDVAAPIDEAANSILERIRSLDFAGQPAATFRSERPVGATITHETMKETPIFRGVDADGRPVVAFLTSGTKTFGLDANVFAELQLLADKVLAVDWAKHALSRKFIEEEAVHWFRSSFRATTQQAGFSGLLSSASRDQVSPLDFWAPIACLEVEELFEFGPVRIAPVTRVMMDELEAKGLRFASSQHDDVAALFQKLRSLMQGFAAVVVHAEAEPHRAYEDGMAIAQNAVGILRFFSPAARELRRVSPTALLGSESMPRAQALVLGDDYFSFSEGFISPPFLWRLSKENVSALWKAGLGIASTLISADGLGEFPLAVRTSLLLFGTGTTLFNPGDRLVYVLSSLEGILLKHSMEPTEFSVVERMSLLLGSDKQGREEVARNVREAYRFRRRHGASVLTPHEENSLAMFAHSAHVVLCIALENAHSFCRKADFIDAVESRKTIGSTS